MADKTPLADLKAAPWNGNLELFARQVVEGFITGLHKSPFHGFSVEFAEHRLYNQGESVKNIDWKLYGRTDRLFVKRFEEETNLRCQIIIDASSSMYYPERGFNKLTFSACAAAALMYLFKKQRDAFGLSYFSDRLELSSPVRSTHGHLKFLFGELEKLMQREQQGRTTALAASLHEIAELLHKRSMVILFTDMFDASVAESGIAELLSGLQHLKHNKHEVIIFHTLHADQEVHFNFGNRPCKFVDMESGEELNLQAWEVKERYVQAISGLINELRLKCSQYHIDFVEADIAAGFTSVLQSYLVKRKSMSV